MRIKQLRDIAPIVASVASIMAMILTLIEVTDVNWEYAVPVVTAVLSFLLGLLSGSLARIVRKLPHAKRMFISYNLKDRDKVTVIVDKLRSANIRPWVASEQLTPGTPFKEAVLNAIEDADKVAVFLSGGVSTNVAYEIGAARQKGIEVVIVKLEDTTLPPDLSDLQVINFGSDPEGGLQTLITFI